MRGGMLKGPSNQIGLAENGMIELAFVVTSDVWRKKKIWNLELKLLKSLYLKQAPFEVL